MVDIKNQSETLPNELEAALTVLHRRHDEPGPHNHPRRYYLPNPARVERLLDLFRTVTFPDHNLLPAERASNRRSTVTIRFHELYEELAEQIYLALRYALPADRLPNNVATYAREQATVIAAQLPLIREALEKDAIAIFDGDPASGSLDEVILTYPGFQAISAYRFAHVIHDAGIPLLPRVISEVAHARTGADIHPAASIGESFFIDHATGVVIGSTAIIGNRVRIYQGVTIGAFANPTHIDNLERRSTKRHPTIQDDVVIYPNATILGGETVIGKESVIGGSTWVTESVDEGTWVNNNAQDPQPRETVDPTWTT